MPKKGPTKQHYVPRTYLAEWIDPDSPEGQEPYVWMFDIKTRKGRNKAPHNILKKTDMYTLNLNHGGKNYGIEETLSTLESKYADILREKIKKHLPINQEEHIYLCAFVSAMLQRTLRMRENIEDFIDRLIEVTEDLEQAHGIKSTKSEEMKQYKIDAHKISVVRTLPDITEILVNMNVAFLCAKGKSKFITSDDPCDLFNPDLQWQNVYGPGLKQKNITLSIPLSPDILACFSWQALRGYIWWPDKEVDEANRMRVGHCHKYIIYNSNKFRRYWASKYPMDIGLIIKILIHKNKQYLQRKRKK